MSDAEAAGAAPTRKRRKVPRVIRRSLLWMAWLSASVLLAIELVASAQQLLD